MVHRKRRRIGGIWRVSQVVEATGVVYALAAFAAGRQRRDRPLGFEVNCIAGRHHVIRDGPDEARTTRKPSAPVRLVCQPIHGHFAQGWRHFHVMLYDLVVYRDAPFRFDLPLQFVDRVGHAHVDRKKNLLSLKGAAPIDAQYSRRFPVCFQPRSKMSRSVLII